jgi:hypothetical protein
MPGSSLLIENIIKDLAGSRVLAGAGRPADNRAPHFGLVGDVQGEMRSVLRNSAELIAMQFDSEMDIQIEMASASVTLAPRPTGIVVGDPL